jgi:hypothetical protein
VNFFEKNSTFPTYSFSGDRESDVACFRKGLKRGAYVPSASGSAIDLLLAVGKLEGRQSLLFLMAVT